MKQLIILFWVIMLCGCNSRKDNFKTSSTIIVGNDTIVIDWKGSDYSGLHGHFHGHGHNDTLNNIFYDTLWLQLRSDTIYIHDTTYTSKHYNHVDKLIIGGN